MVKIVAKEGPMTKQLSSGTRLLSEEADKALKKIYAHVHNPKLINGLFDMQQSKNKTVRAKNLSYF
jgi:hypothetical protein